MKYFSKFLPASLFALIAMVGNHQVSALTSSSTDAVDADERNLNEEELDTLLGSPIAIDKPENARKNRSLSTTITSDMQDMLDLVNAERAANSLPALCYNAKLIAAAQFHSDQMVSLDQFAHTIGSSSMSSRVNDQGYSWTSLAENIAINYSIPATHNSWMNSSGHRANILRTSVQQFGFGMTTQTTGVWSGATYYTQVFGGTASEPCVTTTTPAPTDYPTASPTASPSTSLSVLPTTTSATCDDFPNDFHITMDCAQVSSDTSLCAVPGVEVTCPSSCGTCATCADSPFDLDIVFKGNDKTVDCSFARGRRCKKAPELKDGCRVACGECSP